MKCFLVILTVLILYLLYKIGSMTYERYIDDEVLTVSRPYINIYDQSGNKLNIVAVSKPFSHDEHAKIMDTHENKIIFVGICSYLEFPNEVSSTYEKFQSNYDKYKYKERCKAWIHGFRNPEKYFPEHVPRVLISESDFCDCNINFCSFFIDFLISLLSNVIKILSIIFMLFFPFSIPKLGFLFCQNSDMFNCLYIVCN